MKNRNWLGLCLVIGVLASCAGRGMADAKQLTGEWIYSSGLYIDEKGKSYNSTVSGSLEFKAGGSWKMARRIGNILGSGEGKFVTKGNHITLLHKDKSVEFSGTYLIGAPKKENGKVFRALTLDSKDKDGSRMSYLLIKEEK
jgi:hypothetical protein